MKILVIGGCEQSSKDARTTFEELGAEFRQSADWKSFCSLDAANFEVIVLDLISINSDPAQLFKEVRKLIQGPIVVLHEDDDENEMLYIQEGAQDCIAQKELGDSVKTSKTLRRAIERHRLGTRLQRSAESFKIILETSYDAYFSMDSQWHLTDWNGEAEKTFGWQKSQVLSKPFSILLPGHFRRQYMKTLRHPFSSQIKGRQKARSEVAMLDSRGHEYPVEITILRIVEESQPNYFCFVRNLANMKRTKDELEQLIQERTVKLTQSNDELNRFAKIASHDLQEPLRAVQGFANLLVQSTRGKLDKSSEEFIEYIIDGVDRMQTLIRSVLIHSQITIASDESIRHVTSCNQAIEQVLADLRDTIAESEATIEVDQLPCVAVERSQLVQLFQNLISNSIKYRSAEKPQISISVEQNLNHWLFSVRDNGIGIDPIYSEKIFDMFARLHAKTKYPGTGMGLAICKRVVTANGGTIWMESKPDQGSVFLFTLPMFDLPRKNEMQKHIEILMAEDTPSDIRLTEEALLRSGLKYSLKVVSDGVEVMEHLQQLKSMTKKLPDILLLDLNMPRKNGHEVLEEVKNDLALKSIPVVLLTVSERDEDVLEALRHRMNYYLAKPVSTEKLGVLVKSIYALQSLPLDESGSYSREEAHVRLVLAGNPHTALVALAKLARDPSEKVRARVAENPSAGQAIIEKLAKDPSVAVRLGVIENPSTPHEILLALSKDASDDVRLALSSNPRLPVDLLRLLADDQNVHVSSQAERTLTAISP